MSAVLAPVFRQRFFDSNGDPLVGGKLYSYVAETSTPAATFTDQSGTTPNTNPIVLDANGEANVWLGSGSYKFVLTDSNDVVQWTVDDVSANSTGGTGLSAPWIVHAITDGQAAADLVSQTVDFSKYTSAVYDVEIIRGTTVIANGQIAVQNLNGVGRVKTGMFLAGEAHGVTFSISQVGMVAQLRASCNSGPGNGTIKLSKQLVSI